MHSAFQLVGIVNVQWPATILTDVVRHIDQRIDRTQTNGTQAVLHPGWRRTVLDATHIAPREDGTRAGCFFRELKLDGNWAIVRALHLTNFPFWFELAHASCGEIARDAAHARAIGTIGSQPHVDNGIGKTHDVDVALTHMIAHLRR